MQSEISKIQNPVVKYARSKGIFCTKLTGRGMPDYVFWFNTSPIFIEFKDPEGKASPLQLYRQEQFRSLNYEFFIVDSAKEGKNIIDKYLESERLSKEGG